MYTYDTDAAAMFDDRTHQFEKFGIPVDEIEAVRAATTDMWADAPGGWVYEWSRLAEKYADRGDHYLASLTYGCAKFPCLADPARVTAMQHQLEQFELAAKDFSLAFSAASSRSPTAVEASRYPSTCTPPTASTQGGRC
jgi:esterase FrsA